MLSWVLINRWCYLQHSSNYCCYLYLVAMKSFAENSRRPVRFEKVMSQPTRLHILNTFLLIATAFYGLIVCTECQCGIYEHNFSACTIGRFELRSSVAKKGTHVNAVKILGFWNGKYLLPALAPTLTGSAACAISCLDIYN